MNPELLSMLTPHGIDPLKPRGGKPALTQMDVAAMMAKLKPHESALLRAKYCGEPPHEIWAYWFEHLMGQRWNYKKIGAVKELSKLTLSEHIAANRCMRCRGTCTNMSTEGNVCEACGGTGHMYLSDRKVAQLLGFKHGKLREPWRSRIDWARKELRTWELSSLEKLG